MSLGEDTELQQLAANNNMHNNITALSDNRKGQMQPRPKQSAETPSKSDSSSDGFFVDKAFVWTLIFFQCSFIILYGVGVSYPRPRHNATNDPETDGTWFPFQYAMFQDVHGMMFIGFGFLMTFLRRYGFGALGLNFLLCGFCTQWALFMNGYADYILHIHQDKFKIDLPSLYLADMATAAVLISFGGVIGRASPLQLIWMAFFEIIMYAINFEIVVHLIYIFDAGGSISIHTFGAYFGLTVAAILGKPKNDNNNKSMYHSDMFSMIGTLFLWIWWPSFNAVLTRSEGYDMDRAIINTVLSLSASVVSSFAFSKLLDMHNKFDMVHVQNATLAGGVAMGSATDLYLTPLGPLVIGSIAGIVSVMGFVYLQPFLQRKFGLWDTCGIHNLHGMPGVLGGLASAIAIAGADHHPIYYDDFFTIAGHHKHSYSLQKQAGHQVAGVAITLGLAISWGIIVGFLLKTCKQSKHPYDDVDNFKVPEADPMQPNKDFFRGTIRSGIHEDV